MLAPWKKSYDKPRQHIKKQRHYFTDKVHIVKAMFFLVVRYGCESLGTEELILFNYLLSVASLVSEHGLQGTWASVGEARGISRCSSRALEHRFNSCGPWA